METDTTLDLDAASSVAASYSLSKQNAEHVLAGDIVERMERHLQRFGCQQVGFSYPNPEMLCVPVLQRACRMFWQKHPKLWPRFALSGTGGISVEFRRIK